MADKDSTSVFSPPTANKMPGKRREGRKGSSASISGRYPDEARSDSFSYDEVSEVGPLRQHRKPTPKVVGTIMIWLKNVNRLRALTISKAFYKWKFWSMVPRPNQSELELTVEECEQAAAAAEQKNSYLQLFAENERLREQLADMRRVHFQSDKHLRATSLRLVFSTFLRKKLMMKLRGSFDVWLHNIRLLRLVGDLRQQTVALAVGLQQVESERTYVRQTETFNTQLRMLLSMAIYFFKWKSKNAAAVLREERRMHEDQRRMIFQEVRRMKDLVAFANDQEQTLVTGALKRGEDADAHLTLVKERVAQIVAASRQYKALQAPEQLATLALPPAAAAVSPDQRRSTIASLNSVLGAGAGLGASGGGGAGRERDDRSVESVKNRGSRARRGQQSILTSALHGDT